MDRYYTYLEQVRPGAAAAAGWINRPTNINQKLNLMTVPVEQLQGAEEGSIIYYTGCFSPIHEGHLQAMRIAKAALEEAGEIVLAGVFAPDHDTYASTKPYAEPYTGSVRVQQAWDATEQEPWMLVDSFPAFYCDQDQNFTTLYDRFIAYLDYHIPENNYKVYYLFGSDNYQFSDAFVKYGRGICVYRPGYKVDHSTLLPHENILYPEARSIRLASTDIRSAQSSAPAPTRAGDYYLRDDLPQALPWKTDTEQLATEIQQLLDRLSPAETVRILDTSSQLRTQFPNPSISLDTYWKGDHILACSREFIISSNQQQSLRQTHRPGHPTLPEQVRAIPPGEYLLVDDDVSTGFTTTTISQMLHQYGITITDVRSLTPQFQDFYDIVDARDFIIGAENGGLVVRIKGQLTRMPYMLPYVNLHTRAQIPVSNVSALSDALWHLNIAVHSHTRMTVGDVQGNQDFSLLGFPATMTLVDLARYHLIQA